MYARLLTSNLLSVLVGLLADDIAVTNQKQ
jgi:hypothetical protein